MQAPTRWPRPTARATAAGLEPTVAALRTDARVLFVEPAVNDAAVAR